MGAAVISTWLLTMAVAGISLILLTVCVCYATAGPAAIHCEDEPKSGDPLECCKANRQTLIGHRNSIYQKCSKKNFNQRCCKTCSSHWKKGVESKDYNIKARGMRHVLPSTAVEKTNNAPVDTTMTSR